MNDQPFIAAILADHDDDAPRLIYADYLDEQGECERAEFIRVQIELARDPHESALCNVTGPCGRCSRSLALLRREWELLGVGGLEWSDSIAMAGEIPACFRNGPDSFGYGETRWSFRRGFVHALTCTWDDWSRHADAIRAAQPVCQVTLTTWPELVRRWNEEHQRVEYRLAIDWPKGLMVNPFDAPDVQPNPSTMQGLLRDQWPGIDFRLPPPQPETLAGYPIVRERGSSVAAGRDRRTITETMRRILASTARRTERQTYTPDPYR